MEEMGLERKKEEEAVTKTDAEAEVEIENVSLISTRIRP
jgi:hypothetical protein